MLIVVDDASGTVVASAGEAAAYLTGLTARRRDGELVVEATPRAGLDLGRIVLRVGLKGSPVRLADGRAARLYLVPFPNEVRDRNAAVFLGSFDRRLIAAAGVVALLTLVATWLLARGIVGPLHELRTATADLSLGDLGRRVTPGGGREVAELGEAFNTMAGELERQQTLRRNLLHDVAHELRTPLTALRCRLETVLDGLSPDPARAVRDLHEEVLHLGRLVDDLQDVALAEARELRLDLQEVTLAAVVHSAVRAAGLEEDARLQIDVAAGVSAWADPARLRQILLNLLTNAARHTPAGCAVSVTAAAAPAASGGPRGEVRVEVRNTGSHLEPAALERIFDRFYRGDPARQRATGGTGLGLAIVKHLVEAHGGRVWARSDQDSVTVGFALSCVPAEGSVGPADECHNA
jgi:two-component system sensor histidine kinase BaeS